MGIRIILGLIIYLAISDAASVSRVGNEIEASVSGVDTRSTFLQRDIILTEGVVFAFSAYFRSNKPVTFMIWRPMANETETESQSSIAHELVAQMSVTPSVEYRREDIYIESRLTEKCIRVQQGDRLGIFLEDTPGAVSYKFDSSHPTALSHRLENSTDSYTPGDVITFDALVFPYDFSVAAYIDTDPAHYASAATGNLVDCFRGMLIPEYVDPGVVSTTTTPPPTGAPGATGATGPVGATGPQGTAGRDGARGPMGEAGATGEAGSAGSRGPAGATGASGPEGKPGLVGATGSQGPKGENGERGPPGPAGKTIIITNGTIPDGGKTTDEGSIAFFSKSEMSMGYLIWLIVLTLIIVALIIVIAIIARRRRYQSATNTSNDFGGHTRLPSFPHSKTGGSVHGSWMDTLKDETETTYSNATLEKECPDVTNRESVPNFDYEHKMNIGEKGGSVHGSWMDDMKDETETTYSNATLERERPDVTNRDSVPNFDYQHETNVPEFMY